ASIPNSVLLILGHAGAFEKTRAGAFEKARKRGTAPMRKGDWPHVRRFDLSQPTSTAHPLFSDPLFLVTAIAAVLLVGLAKGGFSGIGMAATPLLALTMPPLQALAILLPILMMPDVISSWGSPPTWDPLKVK